jgi:glycine cleavage system H protein
MKKTNVKKDFNGGNLRSIPKGEQKCLWMSAGHVALKLCDMDFVCEQCGFDEEMRSASVTDSGAHASENGGDRRKAGEGRAWESVSKHMTITGRSAFRNGVPDGSPSPYQFTFNLMNAKFKPGILYSKAHVWLDASDKNVTLGIDSFGSLLLPRVKAVMPLARGKSVDADEPLAGFFNGGGMVRICSPVSGRVVEFNDDVLSEPDLLRTDPYGRGWICRMKTSRAPRESASLLSPQAAAWNSAEDLTKLEKEITGLLKERAHLGDTMLDGGVRITTLPELFGAPGYHDLIAGIFAAKKSR